MIRLGQLLKLAGVVGAGGEAKALLASVPVLRERRAGDPARPSAASRATRCRSAGEMLRVVSEERSG